MERAVFLKAIETKYKGYRFRSRLEARWAVFFDALGLKWDYEFEGFDLGEAGWYLPDFWFPTLKCWVEIKPEEPNEKERHKASELCRCSKKTVFTVIGIPDWSGPDPWIINAEKYCWVEMDDDDIQLRLLDLEEYPELREGIEMEIQDRGAAQLLIVNSFSEIFGEHISFPSFENAVEAARSARFERGR